MMTREPVLEHASGRIGATTETRSLRPVFASDEATLETLIYPIWSYSCVALEAGHAIQHTFIPTWTVEA